MIRTFNDIVNKARSNKSTKRIVAAWPKKEHIDTIAIASEGNMVTPVFAGKGKEIENHLKAMSPSLSAYEIVDEKKPSSALKTAVNMMEAGSADILFQGEIPHGEFLDAVTYMEDGTGTGVISHACIAEMPAANKMAVVTDTYVNNFPTLREKRSIIENAVYLARTLDIKSPNVAVLSAIEHVNPAIESTVDGAVLSKMSERKQFGEGVTVEGPLDIDCALDRKAAERKGIYSTVTGDVDIYVVPDIEVGCQFIQVMIFIGRIKAIGMLLGTTKPVILNTPFIAKENKISEIALAALLCEKVCKNE
jgi:phosphate butyryltransferase